MNSLFHSDQLKRYDMVLRRNKRKQFWPIGLIVLGFIPLMFYRHIGTDPRYHTQQMMEINLPSSDFFKWVKQNNPEETIPPSGNWQVYALTENEVINDQLLTTARQEVTQFMLRQESNHGIQIQLNRNMSYDRFVKIIDMLNLANVTRFTIWNSNVWVHKFPRKMKQETESFIPICGGVHFINNPATPTFFNRFKQTISDYKKYFQEAFQIIPFSVGLVWLLLLGFNIFQIYNKRLAT